MAAMTLSFAEIEQAVSLGHDRSQPLAPIDVSARLAAAQELVAAAGTSGVDDDTPAYQALLVTNILNVRALTGFTGSAGRLVVFPDRSVFVTDGRYAERAADELSATNANCSIVVETTITAQNEAIAKQIESVDAVGLEGGHVTWADLENYDEIFGPQLVRTHSVIESLRRTKSAAELQRLARASKIADDAFLTVWTELANRPTERAFAVLLERTMRELGAHDVSFSSIIASGPNGSRPHHEPGDRVVEEGDLVICDFGALIDGYHSDTTRTVCVGEPSKAQRRHLDAVLRCQAHGRSLVRAGAEGKAIDSACRESLAEIGWDHFFTTGLGHGSGLQIHEEPWLGRTSTSVLAEGDITTVEPGVYVPGDAGVRIEDSMVVTTTDPVLLTRLPYEFAT